MPELYPSTTRCRSCSALVRWTVTAAGKKMPVDAEPKANGNIEIVGGIARYVKAESEVARFWSHFATCPNAASHRQ